MPRVQWKRIDIRYFSCLKTTASAFIGTNFHVTYTKHMYATTLSGLNENNQKAKVGKFKGLKSKIFVNMALKYRAKNRK